MHCVTYMQVCVHNNVTRQFETTERVIAIEIQEAELATNLSTRTQPAAPQQTKH